MSTITWDATLQLKTYLHNMVRNTSVEDMSTIIWNATLQ